ncbi:hypothetical protein GCM10023353_37850 [Tomitella cavernea]|uniref:PrgI family protein n=2 Tax=Tomitella cavernea TaxID=1387982 RepID=A0ABP9D1H2_9ACTN
MEVSKMSEQRTSMLGRESASRGRMGIAEPVLAAYVIVTVLCLAVYVIVGQSWWTLGFIALVAVSTVAVTLSRPGHQSPAEGWVHRLRDRRRRRDGEHLYVGAADPDYGRAGVDPGWAQPVPLGKVDPVEVAGTGLDEMFILEHRPEGEDHYFSVVLSIQGLAAGLRSDAEWAAAQGQFGAAMASMARRSSLVTGWGMVHRSVPADLWPHEAWITARVRANPAAAASAPAAAAYGQTIDELAPHVEEHRAYGVLIFRRTRAFEKEASRVAGRKGAPVRGGIAQVIRDETARAVASLSAARMGQVTVLGEQRACAVFRSFLDPSYPLDEHAGADFDNCWPSYVGGDEAMVVAGRDGDWYTRAGTIHPADIQPVELGPLWHASVLTGVEPDEGDDEVPPAPTIRTVAVRLDLIEAGRARSDAKKHVTQDAARRLKEEKQGRITDGGSEMQQGASERRRADLMPGTGHHGGVFTMSVAVTGRDADDVLRGCARVEAAADEAGIDRIDWHDDSHDVAVFATLPLGRGLAGSKLTRETNPLR